MLSARLEFINVEDLKEHEDADSSHLERLLGSIRAEGQVRKPIIVDSKTLVVLDGAHRLNALKLLNCKVVPAYTVDYLSEEIVVRSSPGTVVTKEDVIKAALTGKKFPPKTTRHMVRLPNGTLKHISSLEREVSVHISTLLASR